MKKASLYLFLFIVTSANGQGWTKTMKDSFLSSCVLNIKNSTGIDSHTAKKFCLCSLEKMTRKYPNPKKTPIHPAEISKIQIQCRDEIMK